MVRQVRQCFRDASVVPALVLMLAATSSFAKPVNETRPLDADGLVTIKNINGSIAVTGWSKNELEVTGTITGDVEGVSVDGTGKRMRVEARFPENSRHANGSADLVIKVPTGASVRVDVVNATITVSKVASEIDLEAVNGDITVSDTPSRVSAQTVNGVISIHAKCGNVEAQTVGGKINLDGIEGDVTASAVGGSVTVSGGKFERVKMSSVSGNIDFAGALGKNATMRAESHSGGITLRLPADVSAEFEGSSFSGDFHNAFGSNGTKQGHGPGRALQFTTGGGDAQVSVTTFSGDVELLKK